MQNIDANATGMSFWSDLVHNHVPARPPVVGVGIICELPSSQTAQCFRTHIGHSAGGLCKHEVSLDENSDLALELSDRIASWVEQKFDAPWPYGISQLMSLARPIANSGLGSRSTRSIIPANTRDGMCQGSTLDSIAWLFSWRSL